MTMNHCDNATKFFHKCVRNKKSHIQFEKWKWFHHGKTWSVARIEVTFLTDQCDFPALFVSFGSNNYKECWCFFMTHEMTNLFNRNCLFASAVHHVIVFDFVFGFHGHISHLNMYRERNKLKRVITRQLI